MPQQCLAADPLLFVTPEISPGVLLGLLVDDLVPWSLAVATEEVCCHCKDGCHRRDPLLLGCGHRCLQNLDCLVVLSHLLTEGILLGLEHGGVNLLDDNITEGFFVVHLFLQFAHFLSCLLILFE
jgi:hypothetical protein